MSSSATSSSSNTGGASVPPNSIAGLAFAIFADFLTTITEDIVLEAHRSEKLIRMAAIQSSFSNSLSSPTASDSGRDRDTTNTSVMAAKQMGRALEVPFREEICPRCLLPRHTIESFAAPPTPGKKWCSKLPIHDSPGCDVHGNPVISSTGNAREKKSRNAELANDRMSPTTDASAPTPPAHQNGAKASGNPPLVDCPNCERSFAVSRFAAHLEKCLGINNRKSARSAVSRGNNASGVATPSLGAVSRRNSPALAVSPASSGVNADENSAGGGSVPPIAAPTTKKEKAAANGDKKSTTVKKKQSKKDKLALDSAEKLSSATAPVMEKSVSAQTLRATGSPTPPPSVQMPAPSASSQKKKKRKAEALEGDGDTPTMKEKDKDNKDKSNSGEKLSKKDRDKDAAGSGSKPHGKKQKTGATPSGKDGVALLPPSSGLPPLPSSTQAKSQLSKFKNRAGSPSLGSPNKKDKLGSIEMHRSQSDTSLGTGHSEQGPNSSPPPTFPLGLKGSPTKTPTRLSTSMTQSSTKLSSKASASGLGSVKLPKDKKLDKDRDKVSGDVSKEGKDGSHTLKKEKSGKPRSSTAFTGASTPKPGGVISVGKDSSGASASPEKKKIPKSATKLGNSPSGKAAGKSLPKNPHRSESPSTGKHSASNPLAMGNNSNGKREREKDDGVSDASLPRKKSKEDNDGQF